MWKKKLWRVSAVTVIAQVNAKLSESDSEIHWYETETWYEHLSFHQQLVEVLSGEGLVYP